MYNLKNNPKQKCSELRDEYCLEVSGDLACFTRPDMKVERVSYPVITPSVAEAIFSSILMKPYAMRWDVTRIEVLNPIRWINVRRNETAALAIRYPIYAQDVRTQKAALILRNVRYRIYARLIFIPLSERPADKAFTIHEPRPDDCAAKYHEMFLRRTGNGSHFFQPYFGTREFPVWWRRVDDVRTEPATLPETRNLGLMFYGWKHWDGRKRAQWFRANMVNGVINVPSRESREVLCYD